MLQRLLVEQAGLVIHHDRKQKDGFDLVVSKGGVRMSNAEPPPLNDTDSVLAGPLKFVKDKAGRDQIPPGRPMALRTGLGGLVRIMARMQGVSDIVKTLQ